MKLPVWLKRILGKMLFDDRVTAQVIDDDRRYHTYIDPVSRLGIRLDIETPVEGMLDDRVIKLPLKKLMEIVGEKAVLDPIFQQVRESNARVHVHHPGTEN